MCKAIAKHVLLVAALVAAALLATGQTPVAAELRFTRADSLLGIQIVCGTYGPTWGDFTADGRIDLFVTNHGNAPNLFRNAGGTAFIDERPGSGIHTITDQHGGAWGDFDNDGLLDLYVAVGAEQGAGTGENELYRNLDGLHFAEIGLDAGVQDPAGRGRFVHWVDVDNDGWLDLFVTNFDSPNQLFLNQGGAFFIAAEGAGGLEAPDLWYGAWTHLDGDHLLDVILSAVTTGRLAVYRNLGTGVFQEITAETNLPGTLWGVRSLCWIDYDNDGDQDLYVSRGHFSCNGDGLWFNESEVRTLMLLPVDPQESEGFDGIDIGASVAGLVFDIHTDWHPHEVDRIFLGPDGVNPDEMPFTMSDGEFIGTPEFIPGLDHGCYIWQDSLGGAWHVRGTTDFARDHRFGVQAVAFEGAITEVESVAVEVPLSTADVGDRLYRNRGDGTFQEVTAAAGIADSRDGRSALAADFDNDGWLDLYVVNAGNLSGYLAQNEPNLCYHNNGDGTFTEIADSAGAAGPMLGTGAGAGWTDFNDDGYPDLCVTNGWACFPLNQGPHVILRNEGGENHWLKVRLVGTLCNRDAVGARVRINAGRQVLERIQNGAVADMSQSSSVLHFGLGPAEEIYSLTVEWPDGLTDQFYDLDVDQTLVIEQGASGATPPDAAPDRGADISLASVLTGLAISNPSVEPVRIECSLSSSGPLQLAIHDAAGRRILILADGVWPAGRHLLQWDGRMPRGEQAATGVYFAKLVTEGGRRIRPILLVR